MPWLSGPPGRNGKFGTVAEFGGKMLRVGPVSEPAQSAPSSRLLTRTCPRAKEPQFEGSLEKVVDVAV